MPASSRLRSAVAVTVITNWPQFYVYLSSGAVCFAARSVLRPTARVGVRTYDLVIHRATEHAW
jgi:hypothetical protein